MKLFVIPNLMTENQIKVAREAINTLHNSLNLNVALSKDDSYLIYGSEEFSSFSAKDSDYIVSIGGDACVLKSAKTAIKYRKPLIGINAGRLGYLCCIHISEITSLNEEKILSFKQTKRSLLDVQIKNRHHFAINDLIIGKGNFGKSIEVAVNCDNRRLASWVGDGLIIATPTGSTAYNQSAGGPVLRYDSPSFAITPICPHLSNFKPVVVSNDSVISVSSFKTPENTPCLYSDGTKLAELNGEILIKKYSKELILCVR